MGACLACLACETCCGIFSACCSCIGCCGKGKKGEPGSSAHEALIGRVRALGLMLFSIVLAIVAQYEIYKIFDSLDAWEDGCDDPTYSDDYRDICIGNTAVYRISFVDAVFFLIMAFCACCSPVFNNGFWGFKLFLWALLVLGSIFVSNDVVGTDGYVWPARIGGFIFIIMQQLVLIDLAYRINDTMVEKANVLGDDTEGRPYLAALVLGSVVLFVGSLVVIGVMFYYFGGCPANELVLSLTLLLPIALVLLQLSGEEGNLLSTAFVTAYGTYLGFSAVSKTPEDECNPFVGESNFTAVVIGVILTVLSLFWVTLNAARTIPALLGGDAAKVEEAERPMQTSGVLESGDKSRPFVQSAVPVGDEPRPSSEHPEESRPPAPTASGQIEGPEDDDGGLGWRFNVVMILISMYFAMTLTNWGDINVDDDSSDPKYGWTAMWLNTCAQWVCFIIYGWTLVAPRVFPDREFS